MGGERRQRALGWFPAGATQTLRATASALIDSGELGAARSSPGSGAPKTVGDLVTRYLDERRHHVWTGDPRERPRARGIISASTFEKYQYAGRHLEAWLGEHLLTELTEADLRSYAVNRRHHDTRPARSDRTIQLELKVLGFAWRWARKRGWVTGELTTVVTPDPEDRVNNHRNPTLAEVRAVLAHLAGDERLAVELCAWTGARVGELTERLRLRDVDLDRGVLRILGKGARWREVPIHPRHLPLLAERKRTGEPDDLVLQASPERLALRKRDCTGICKRRLRLAVLRACEVAEVPPFTPQGIRRMADDVLYDADTDPSTSGEILGHSPQVAMESYRRVRVGRKREAMLRAGMGALFREEGDNIIQLPGASSPDQGHDLSAVPSAALVSELERRGIVVSRETRFSFG